MHGQSSEEKQSLLWSRFCFNQFFLDLTSRIIYSELKNNLLSILSASGKVFIPNSLCLFLVDQLPFDLQWVYLSNKNSTCWVDG